eukprot:scaffold19398_cov76-Skeletonema_dohrnii-CCMP3373.AAC.5
MRLETHPSQILYRLQDIRPRGQGRVSYLRKRVVTRAREVVQSHQLLLLPLLLFRVPKNGHLASAILFVHVSYWRT